MRHKKLQILVVLLFVLYQFPGIKSQEYRINNYGISQGLANPFVYTVSQDNNGYIWLGTGQGLDRFNGFSFIAQNPDDSLAGQVAAISYADKKGHVWFGYQSGDVAVFNGNNFLKINTGETKSAITGFAELPGGNMIIATQSTGIFYSTGKEIKKTEGLPDLMITTVFADGNVLLIGSMEGMHVCSMDNDGKRASVKIAVKELEFSRIQDIQRAHGNNRYWVATEEQGVFSLLINGDQYVLEKTGEIFGFENQRVQAVFQDDEKNLWISTQRNGAYKLIPDENGSFSRVSIFNKETGLSGSSVRKVFQDPEGNIWIAMYGDGLSMLTGQSMMFRDFDYAGIDNDIQSVVMTAEGTCYLGGPEGLFRLNKTGGIEKPVRVNSIPQVKITALQTDGNNLYIGTENSGLYILNTVTNKAAKIAYNAYSMGLWVSAIAISPENIFIATKDGIYQFGKNLQEQAHYTTTNGMPHNYIEDVIIDSHNRLLFATKADGIYQVGTDGSVSQAYPTNNEVEFKSIAEDENGNLWAATYGGGVLVFRDDSVYQFTVRTGLKADFCYSVLADGRGSVWVGHRMGMSRINVNNMLISIYDQHMGVSGDFNLNSKFRSPDGTLLFGTTSGLITYNPAKDKRKHLPPFTNIVSLLISDKPYNFNEYVELPYQEYSMRIEFIGLNYSDPQSVRYQYKLEGYDLDWSDVTSQTTVNYPRIEDGDYTFYVRSYNSEGLSQETPVSFHIRIKPPIWKRWWFIGLSFLTLVFLFFLIMKYRERKQKQLQEYLERELTARTKEVVEQKEVIEIKNRDITDSINYAKRIQTSMLPPVKRLQHYFSGSFVFYSPRDIVSGDFYWFDKVNDNKFTIVCADSTGHGVPGAFMSMIGSTLIKDICLREAGNSPCKVLQVLDCELRNTLNQDLEDGSKPGDGMDIIVCEIDLKTHYVRYASAMRPMIIYKDGEEIFVKGSRNSVGGHYDKADNIFEDEGLQLSKGDIIYMFSDGYSDQFGGPMGKKFKMVRLKSLLQDIHKKPMDEQCLHVKNTFNLWKENYEQVDDVLFMGIKI